jgi:voltage-gated potassium channel
MWWFAPLAAVVICALSVFVHATGTYINLHWILWLLKKHGSTNLVLTWGFVARLVVLLLIMHSIEVAIWAGFYTWQHCFSDWHTAYYFSLVTYTTLGYGDVLLPKAWRSLGGWEAMTGVLMFGWSTASMMSFLHHIQSARLGKYFQQQTTD